jgi:TonB family protein
MYFLRFSAAVVLVAAACVGPKPPVLVELGRLSAPENNRFTMVAPQFHVGAKEFTTAPTDIVVRPRAFGFVPRGQGGAGGDTSNRHTTSPTDPSGNVPGGVRARVAASSRVAPGIRAESVVVTGRVTAASTGAALKAVSVIILNTTRGGISNDSGDYVIQVPDSLREQVVTVAARRIGYSPASEEIILSGDTVRVDFELETTVLRLQTVTTGEAGQPTVAPRPATTSSTPGSTVPEPSPLFEFQVGKPAMYIRGSAAPAYPVSLRPSNIAGRVVVLFVVDTSGFAQPATFKMVESSHELFTAAIRNALPEMRFVPAEVGGRKVKMWIQQTFEFNPPPDGE